MKILKHLIFILLAILLTSCSESNEIKNQIPQLLPTLEYGTVVASRINTLSNTDPLKLTIGNISTAKIYTVTTISKGMIVAVSMDISNQEIIVASTNGEVWSWDIQKNISRTLLSRQEIVIGTTVFNGTGQIMATTSNNRKRVKELGLSGNSMNISIFDLKTQKLVKEIKELYLPIAITLSDDEKFGYSSSEGSLNSGIDIENKYLPGSGGVGGGGNYGEFDAIAFSKNNQYVAYATRGGMVMVDYKVFDVLPTRVPFYCQLEWGKSKERNSLIIPDLYNPLAIQFSPDLRLLALVRDETLLVYDLARCKLRYSQVLGDTKSPAASISFSPDATLLAISTKNGIKVLDSLQGTVLFNIKDESYSIVFSHDQKILVYGDENGGLKKISLLP